MTNVLAVAIMVTLHVTAVPPPCDMSKSGQDFCADFCNNRCGFYNTSAGETGRPQNLTVYRITPANVTGLVNKNTADAPGDISFVISKKNTTQQCLHDPTSMGCSTDIESMDLYGEFLIEIDAQWGPYQMCNPALGWDTSHWFCGTFCLQPTEEGCNPIPKIYQQNGSHDGSPMCWCDRAQKTVGRELAPGATGRESYMPDVYPPQCAGGYLPMDEARGCLDGGAGQAAYKTVTSWSFAGVASKACQVCYADAQCTGWRSLDNRTAELFQTPLRNVSTPAGAASCVGARRYHSRWGSGSSWYGLAALGGCTTHGCENVWYSTTAEGQCAPGAPLGTDGCSWRLVQEVKYANATCVDDKADAAVEAHGQKCFDTCPRPLNKNTDCYLDCYRNTLMGDASQNLTAVDPAAMVAPWKHAFAEDDPAKGGCPPVKPTGSATTYSTHA